MTNGALGRNSLAEAFNIEGSEMKQEYIDWIKGNYPTPESARNKCREAATNMALRFPELELQCGFANGLMHCWTKTCSGEIIDPTEHQFGSGKLEYIFVANHLLRKDQVDETTLTVFLDDGRVVVGI